MDLTPVSLSKYKYRYHLVGVIISTLKQTQRLKGRVARTIAQEMRVKTSPHKPTPDSLSSAESSIIFIIVIKTNIVIVQEITVNTRPQNSRLTLVRITPPSDPQRLRANPPKSF